MSVTAPSLSVPAQAVELVKAFEGFRATSYVDPGTNGVPVTIGYGCTKDEDGTPWPLGCTIDAERATRLLERDLGASALAVAKAVQVALPEPCRAALISFVYNVGAGAFGTSTMLKCINAGKLTQAADEFPKWNRGGGRVLNGLITRRAAERKVFLSGIPA